MWYTIQEAMGRGLRPESLFLSLEHDQLLAQEGVLQHQLGFGPHQVRHCIENHLVTLGLGPMTNGPFPCLVKRAHTSLYSGKKREGHSFPFCLVIEGYDFTVKKGR